MHKKNLYALFFFYLLSQHVYGQFGSIAWTEIYKDKDITVSVAFDTSNQSCVLGNKPNSYYYIINGSKKTYQYFVNWTMSYLQCNGILYEQDIAFDIGPNCHAKNNIEYHNDLDYIFTGTILKAPYGMSADYAAKVGGRVLALLESLPPDHINGESTVVLGHETTLEVAGGSLGIDANWFWYRDSCGGARIGHGATIMVKPDIATRYFVRAEGKNNITACASILLNVDKKSKAPTGISGLPDNKLCSGTSATLSVSGGALGPGSQWVWYEGQCGGENIGTGESISITPKKNTTYYVRAEGPYNTTTCTSTDINVFEYSSAANSITGATSPCEQTNNIYTVEGGKLAPDAQWKWYGGECNQNYYGSGNSMNLKIAQTGTLLVRAEGFCNTTVCTSLLISPNKSSVAPSSISATNLNPPKNKPFYLSPSGGALGTNAKWVWYKSFVTPANRIGDGAQITAKTKKPERYYLIAEGVCNNTSPVVVYINPIKIHDWHKRYYSRNYDNTFLHVGYSFLGIEYLSNYLPVHCIISPAYGTQTTIDSFVSMTSFGYKAEVNFHPIIKKYFSLGLTGSLSGGGGLSTEYSRILYGTDIAAGANPFKLLMQIKRENMSVNYSNSTTDNAGTQYTIEQKQKVTRDFIGFGFRFGRYGHKAGEKHAGKKARCLDFTYNFSRFDMNTTPPSLLSRLKDYQQWQHGFTCLYWVQNDIKLQFDYSLNDSKYEVGRSNGHSKSDSYALFTISFYTRDYFY